MERTGALGPDPGRVERYLQEGAARVEQMLRLLPPDVDLAGGRILDFGCGAGRVLRHLVQDERWDPARPELFGTDVDEPSIAWIQEHLGHAVTADLTSEVPGLPYPDGHFDLVFAWSVFTHLSEHWAGWLLECHRVLKPGGILVATTLGASMSEHLLHEPWRAERVGIQLTGAGRPWDEGGPFVFCSPWWIRSHWGRVFDIVSPVGEPPRHAEPAHDVWVLRRKEVHLDVAALEAWDPDDLHEAESLRHSFWAVWRELAELRQATTAERAAWLADRAERDSGRRYLEAELARWQDVAAEWQRRTTAAEARAAALGEEAAAAHGAHAELHRRHDEELATTREAHDALERQREAYADLHRRYDVLVTSRSWRTTAPLRRIAARAQAARRTRTAE